MVRRSGCLSRSPRLQPQWMDERSQLCSLQWKNNKRQFGTGPFSMPVGRDTNRRGVHNSEVMQPNVCMSPSFVPCSVFANRIHNCLGPRIRQHCALIELKSILIPLFRFHRSSRNESPEMKYTLGGS